MKTSFEKAGKSGSTHPLSSRNLSSHARQDLLWWSSALKQPFLGVKLCQHPIPDDSLHIFVDASSSWGIGIIINNQFDCFRLSDNWNTADSGRDIGWAEFVALELATRALIHHLKLSNRHILIHSDNQGVIGAWNSRSSRSLSQNEVLSRILHCCVASELYISLEYVSTLANPADSPSRGLVPSNCSRVYFGLGGFPTPLRGLLHRS
jgi:hypothetical protein